MSFNKYFQWSKKRPKKALFEKTQKRSFRKAETANIVNSYMELGSEGGEVT